MVFGRRVMLNRNSSAHLKLIFLFISLQQSGFTTPFSHSVASFFIRCINHVRLSQHAEPIGRLYVFHLLLCYTTFSHIHTSFPFIPGIFEQSSWTRFDEQSQQRYVRSYIPYTFWNAKLDIDIHKSVVSKIPKNSSDSGLHEKIMLRKVWGSTCIQIIQDC